MAIIQDIVWYIILVLMSISTIIVVAEALGFLPYKMAAYFFKNRLLLTATVLREMGIDIDKYQRAVLSADTYAHVNMAELGLPIFQAQVNQELEEVKINKKVSVGKVSHIESNYYINLMGATTDPKYAKRFARILSTYWKKVVNETGIVQHPDFDFIVTPKLGSPILAYEFSVLVGKPLVLHSEEKKFETNTNMAESIFDFSGELPVRGKALLLDDSTTGGRKIIIAAKDLRELGFYVGDCLVVFEPTIKNVRAILRENDISLHSIVQL